MVVWNCFDMELVMCEYGSGYSQEFSGEKSIVLEVTQSRGRSGREMPVSHLALWALFFWGEK